MDKGKYYKIIIDMLRSNGIGVKYLYKEHIKQIYDSIPHYFPDEHNVCAEEFKFSIRWVLADMFGEGTQVDEPEDLFDFLDKM